MYPEGQKEESEKISEELIANKFSKFDKVYFPSYPRCKVNPNQGHYKKSPAQYIS